MAYTIEQVMTRIQTTVTAVTGVRKAPAKPPEQMSVFPFAICLPATGEYLVNGGWAQGLDEVTLDIHVARRDLPRDVDKLIVFWDSIPAALNADTQLNGTICVIRYPIRRSFATFNWGALQTIGIRFVIPVKIAVS
jgi:hypothetical protein